jgi:two-component system phosphate regulon sensor histidine kinase PhoR
MTLPPYQRETRFQLALSGAALVIAISGTLAWLACWILSTESLLARGGFLLVPMIAGAGLLHLGLRRVDRREETARHYLERLSLADPQRIESLDLPPLDPQSPWSAALELVKQMLASASGRLADAEHARAVLELRCKRSVSQYQRLRRIVEALPEPLLAVDQYDDIWLANSSAEELFDLEPCRDGEKRALAQLGTCRRLLDLLDDTRRRKVATTRSDEFEMLRENGDKVWYRAVATGIAPIEPNGQPSTSVDSVVAVLRDVSVQKTNQRHNAEFVSAASHEMKTPLAGIKAYVELLADGEAEDEQTREEFLSVINGQAERLERLIDNLLNLARIEAGVVQVSKQPQSLNEILIEACNVVQPSADAKRINLAHYLSTMYLGVLVDRDMILQAAINLLSNAIKYTKSGGSVTLRSRMLDAEVEFEVQDTGVGLAPEDCGRVFAKFYRVERNKGMASGTGLGLPLAKYIVEDVHGGRMSVTSTLDVGSTFSARLPAAGRS